MKIELSLLDNGLDYLIEGVQLTTPIGHNHFGLGYSNIESIWKYSVLNVFSGIELILKEKLRKEHWSLIFDDVNNASEQKLIQGDFVSVSHNEAVKRLKGICNIVVKDEAINNLRKLRNRFEHFEVKTTILECKKVIAEAIRELIIFWDESILLIADDDQNQRFSHIKSMVFEFDTYVENMLQKNKAIIDNIVKNNAGILVHCRNCSNESFIVYKDDNKDCQCFVCEEKISKADYLKKIREYENRELPSELASILGDEFEYNKHCSNCDNETKIKFSPGYFLTSKEYKSDYFFCINCLHFETADEIRSREFEKEIAELREKHTKEEFIQIISKKQKELEDEINNNR